MTSATYILTVVITAVAASVATAWMTGMLVPLIIYIRTYSTEGQKAAEEKALDAMGESKVSYGVKDSMKQTTITDNKEVNDVQGGLGETVGGQFGSDGIAGGLGKGLSKAL